MEFIYRVSVSEIEQSYTCERVKQLYSSTQRENGRQVECHSTVISTPCCSSC